MERHRIIIAPSSISGQQGLELLSGQEYELLTLPHPSNQAALCVRIKDQLYEINQGNIYRNSCWLINQRISSSGSLNFLSKIDIRFLVLPFLAELNGKFCPLDQIVYNIPGYSDIPLDLVTVDMMKEMCDVNDKYGPDSIFYRYNEEKVIAWLKIKVAKAASVVCLQRIRNVGRGDMAFSSHFKGGVQSQPTTTTSSEPDKEDERVALEIVSDYLSVPIAEKLFAAYGLQSSDVWKKSSASTKRKADWELELEYEKEFGLAPNPAAAPKPASNTAAVKPAVVKTNKALETAAKGTKSIQSFFRK